MKRTKIVARIMKRTKIVARISTGSRIYARIIKVRKNPKKVRKNPKSTQESVKKSRIYARIKDDFCSRTVWRGVANPRWYGMWISGRQCARWTEEATIARWLRWLLKRATVHNLQTGVIALSADRFLAHSFRRGNLASASPAPLFSHSPTKWSLVHWIWVCNYAVESQWQSICAQAKQYKMMLTVY